MSAFYPAMLNIQDRQCVVVGGGRVAARKVESLLAAGARVTVVAPRLIPELERTATGRGVTVHRRAYEPADLDRATLVFAATNVRQVNACVAEDAARRGLPVNVADDPDACTFHVPAVLRRAGLTVSVSTEGRSPAFARRIREELERVITPERVVLLELYAELREALAAEGRAVPAGAWRAGDEIALALLQEGRREDARRWLREEIIGASVGA